MWGRRKDQEMQVEGLRDIRGAIQVVGRIGVAGMI